VEEVEVEVEVKGEGEGEWQWIEEVMCSRYIRIGQAE
jgi:hypothetical protein